MRISIALGLATLAVSASAKTITIKAGDDFEASCLHVVEPGDTCYLEKGDYYHDGLTVIHGTEDKRITITGDSAACIKGSNTQDRVLQIAHDYYTVKNICFDGKHDNDEYTATAIYVLGADRKSTKKGVTSSVTGFQMFDLEIKNFSGECVHFRYFVTHAEVSGCLIQHCGIDAFLKGEGGKVGEGIYIGTALDQVDDDKAPEVKIRTGSADNVKADVCAYNWIHHNTFRTYGNECVDIKEGSAYNLVETNVCEHQLDKNSGCFGARGSDNTFRWNQIAECTGAGIRVGGDKGYGQGNNMYGNDITNAERGAFNVMSSKQGTVCGNRLSGIDLISFGAEDEQEQFSEAVATGDCSSSPGDHGLGNLTSSDRVSGDDDESEESDDDDESEESDDDNDSEDDDDDAQDKQQAATLNHSFSASGDLEAGINYTNDAKRSTSSTRRIQTNSAVSSGGLGLCDSVVAVTLAEVHHFSYADPTTGPENLFDGDTSTYFSVHRESTYITFELEKEMDVTGLAIGFFMKSAEEKRIQDFTVSLRKAADTDYRTPISHKQSSGEMGNLQTFSFNSRKALYVRLETHGNSFNNWSAFTEVEVCVKPGVEENALFGGVNAVGDELEILAEQVCGVSKKLSPVNARASGKDDVKELFDGSFITRWATSNTQNDSDLSNDMVYITFQGDTRVSSLEIAFFDGHLAHQYFSVYVQSHGSHTWTPVLLNEQAAMLEGMQTFDINLDGVHNLYIVGKGNDVGTFSKFAEVEVHGC